MATAVIVVIAHEVTCNEQKNSCKSIIIMNYLKNENDNVQQEDEGATMAFFGEKRFQRSAVHNRLLYGKQYRN